jgi:hypothetical protein
MLYRFRVHGAWGLRAAAEARIAAWIPLPNDSMPPLPSLVKGRTYFVEVDHGGMSGCIEMLGEVVARWWRCRARGSA